MACSKIFYLDVTKRIAKTRKFLEYKKYESEDIVHIDILAVLDRK